MIDMIVDSVELSKNGEAVQIHGITDKDKWEEITRFLFDASTVRYDLPADLSKQYKKIIIHVSRDTGTPPSGTWWEGLGNAGSVVNANLGDRRFNLLEFELLFVNEGKAYIRTNFYQSNSTQSATNNQYTNLHETLANIEGTVRVTLPSVEVAQFMASTNAKLILYGVRA